MDRAKEALEYHSRGRKGKVEVVPTKPCLTQRDLSLAYTPGVAVPCKRIEANPDEAYEYTAKGNLVAVLSNGTAVLGLGDIGAMAGKPVMEGKGVLFKRFADVDVFDIEVDTHDPEKVIEVAKLIAPTFGGINLEDIKAPECFEIERRLVEELDIPVFHDDQHGTAIISGAALINALQIAGKPIEEVKIVFNGAGAAGIACARIYMALGARKENLILCDSKGVVYKGRTKGMNAFKEEFAVDTDLRTLADAMRGADVFCGLSIADCVTPDMVKSMNERPIIFAMANPDPEIKYELAREARPDALLATGRSDYPNQVNNVLGFPFIFRGTLDVRATTINEEMKLAATRALAALARQDVPDSVARAYGLSRMRFGPEYLIPKPFDHRVLLWVSSAVAKAAMDTGVARRPVDIEEYKEQLQRRLGTARAVMRAVIHDARQQPARIVFPEAEHAKVLRAAQIIGEERIAHPVLLGRGPRIEATMKEYDLSLEGAEIIDLEKWDRRDVYIEELYRMRQRKGMTLTSARKAMRDPIVVASMMVHLGEADALVAGIVHQYPETIRPTLGIIGMREGVSRVAAVYMLLVKDKPYFITDATVTVKPTAEQLAEFAINAAAVAQRFHVTPRIAMLSFSNFGSTRNPDCDKMARAAEIVRELRPDLQVDGEMQADIAVHEDRMRAQYPFCRLEGPANVLVCPDLQSANIAYKLLQHVGGATAIGPILMGMRKPVHLLQEGCEVDDIVHMTAVASVEAQEAQEAPARQEA